MAVRKCTSGDTEPPVITALLELRAPTSRGVAAPGSSPLQSPPGGNCSTSTAPSLLGSTGTELDRRRRHQARQRGSDRRPHRRGRQGVPTRLGGTPLPPSALLVVPICRTRVRDYPKAQARSCPAGWVANRGMLVKPIMGGPAILVFLIRDGRPVQYRQLWPQLAPTSRFGLVHLPRCQDRVGADYQVEHVRKPVRGVDPPLILRLKPDPQAAGCRGEGVDRGFGRGIWPAGDTELAFVPKEHVPRCGPRPRPEDRRNMTARHR